jgi:hypothetical protein
MTQPKPDRIREHKATTHQATSDRIMVLLGYDENERPRAAKFYEWDFDAAKRAAELMKLQTHECETKKLRRALGKVAVGDIYKSGWAGIPHIRKNQYEALVKKLTGKMPSKPGAPIVSGYPTSWQQIEVGHLVIAPADKPEDGYWPAVVTAIDGEMLTLTLRDYPDEKGKRHRTAVALLDSKHYG